MRDPRFWLLLAVGVSLGLLIAWLHAGPINLDTGLAAMLTVAVSLILGFTMPRYAWLWALAVSIWLPALDIVMRGNAASLLLLPLGFVGAYAGLFARRAWTVLSSEEANHHQP
ncbi:MAG: hypothetical protein KIS91_05800 [Anaerolineae bacterium]|nr:hypothetical protein [Anaerolineae bacterium]